MSTSPRRDHERHVEPHEEQAEYLGEAFAETQHACRDAVRKNAPLAHVAHYSRGVFDFSVDTLGEGVRREPIRRLGRRLGFAVNELDRTLQEPRTGPLIRTVVHTEKGAVVCESVVPRENVIGICLAQRDHAVPLSEMADVRAADEALSELVTHLRARISLPSLNHGGWATAGAVEALTSVEPPGEPHISTHGDVPSHVFQACRDAVRPEDLQYLAYCADGEPILEVDQFDHPSNRPFFTQITVAARRSFYRGFTRQLGTVAQQFNRLTSSGIPGGLLVRLVLDVEQGAIYYYRLNASSYLVGVTINQARVSGADDRIAELAVSLSAG